MGVVAARIGIEVAFAIAATRRIRGAIELEPEGVADDTIQGRVAESALPDHFVPNCQEESAG